jgi:hypothetical protein
MMIRSKSNAVAAAAAMYVLLLCVCCCCCVCAAAMCVLLLLLCCCCCCCYVDRVRGSPHDAELTRKDTAPSVQSNAIAAAAAVLMECTGHHMLLK